MNFIALNKILFCLSFRIFFITLLSSTLHAEEARELEWTDLAPAGYLESLEYNKPLTFNNFFDNLTGLVGLDSSKNNTETLTISTEDPQVSSQIAPVVPELDDQYVKLAGFITPLSFDFNQGTFSEFLLVPYFGACIHVPPPPTNQVVYVSSAVPLNEDMLDNPIWIQGTLKTENVSNEFGHASYKMQDALILTYTSE